MGRPESELDSSSGSSEVGRTDFVRAGVVVVRGILPPVVVRGVLVAVLGVFAPPAIDPATEAEPDPEATFPFPIPCPAPCPVPC